MTDPLVTCVLLTADRPAMTARAVKSFLSQTYERKALLIFDNGKSFIGFDSLFDKETDPMAVKATNPIIINAGSFRGSTIGALRNAANELCRGTDIIAHFDSDDWSHPYRLAEQVNLLQASRADAVGYHDMLIWQGTPAQKEVVLPPGTQPCTGSAHLYRYDGPRAVNTYALETSLLYWRRSWERKKFHDSNLGDRYRISDPTVDPREQWRCVSTSSHCDACQWSTDAPHGSKPRMIAEIHGSNTVMRPDLIGSHNFKRVPEWDGYCRTRMTL